MTAIHRTSSRRDDRGSMPLAMLITVMGIGFSSLLASVLSVQLLATRTDTQRAKALGAAQAGLNIGLAYIRGATNADGGGDIAKLPCVQITGTAGSDNTGSYQVSVSYFVLDPHGHNATWLAQNGRNCPSGTVPRYATLTSNGTDGSNTTRRLTATYAFKTASNPNIAGGLVHLLRASDKDPDLCLTGVSATPGPGTPMHLEDCADGNGAQTFAYRPDLTMALVDSATTTYPNGMCIDAGATPSAGSTLTFRQCVSPAIPQQQWSYNDWRNFEGTSNGVTLNDLCFNAGGTITLGSTSGGSCHGAPDQVQSFAPDAKVGAGAAGEANNQLVNFEEFGRCLDVPKDLLDISDATYWDYVMVYPCKQAPKANDVSWNQKWTLPVADGETSGTGPIYTTHPTKGTFCLTMAGASTSPPLVMARPCNPGSGVSTDMIWTITGRAATYGESFLIEDALGRCLATSAYVVNQLANKAVSVSCTGDKTEKWNAEPDYYKPSLYDLGEK
jgi:hypothetical protein